MRGGYDEGLRTVERLVQAFGGKAFMSSCSAIAIANRKLATKPLSRSRRVPAASAPGYQRSLLCNASRPAGAGCAHRNSARTHRSKEQAFPCRAMRSVTCVPPKRCSALRRSSGSDRQLGGAFTTAPVPAQRPGYEFPRYPVGEGETMISFLRERTREGFEWRYGAQSRNLRTRARCPDREKSST